VSSSLTGLEGQLGGLGWRKAATLSSGCPGSEVQGITLALQSLANISLQGSVVYCKNLSNTLADLANLGKLGSSTAGDLSNTQLAEFVLKFGQLGEEFALALQVVDLSGLPSNKQDDLRASIWRRAMIRDDWLVLNETGGKDVQRVEEEMQQSSLFRALQRTFWIEQNEGTQLHLLSPNEILSREAFPASLQDRLGESEVKESARMSTKNRPSSRALSRKEEWRIIMVD